MNDVAQRIHDRLILLQRDESTVRRQLQTLENTIHTTTSTMHHLEFKSISDATRDSDPHGSVLHDAVELRRQRANVKQAESDAVHLKEKLKKIETLINSHTFWEDYATTTDLSRQNEAQDWFKHPISY